MYSCMLLRRCLAWQHMVGYMQEYACHLHFLVESYALLGWFVFCTDVIIHICTRC